MRKTLISIMLSLSIATGLVACGKSKDAVKITEQETETKVAKTEEAETTTEAATTAEETKKEEVTTEEETTTEVVKEREVAATYLLSNYYEYMDFNFSEGFAWCNYAVENKTKIGIIDKEGFLVFQSPEDWTNCGGVYESTEFYNGTACVYMRSGAPVVKSFLVNTEGEILFDSTTLGDNVKTLFLTSGDGIYLFREEKSDFYDNKTYLVAIDSEGNTINEAEYTGNKSVDNADLFYLGEGIFVSRHFGVVYNTRTGNIIYCDKEYGSVVDCDNILNGKCLVSDKGVAPISIFDSQENYDSFISSAQDVEGNWGGSTTIYADETWGCFYFINDGNYYKCTLDGSEGLLVEPEHNGTPIYFNGEYASIMMHGADGEQYISMIDRDGSLVYDPVMAKGWNMWSTYNENCLDGYLYAELKDNSRIIITPEGKSLVIGEDDLSEVPENGWIGRICNKVISNGMVNLHSLYASYTLRDPMKLPPICYINCSDNSILKEVKVEKK